MHRPAEDVEWGQGALVLAEWLGATRRRFGGKLPETRRLGRERPRIAE
jgi:hypothetical protein